MVKNRGGRGGGQMNRNQRNGNMRNQGRPVINRNKIRSQQYRIQKPKQDVIAQNLMHLQQNIQKRKMAQARYYNTNVRSPVKTRGRGRGNARINMNPNSVHNRLGNGSVGLQTKKMTNSRVFNNSNMRGNNSVIGRKTQRFNQKLSVQSRLQTARNQPNRSPRNNIQPSATFVRKPLKLKRNIVSQPTNVMVQFDNVGRSQGKHSVNGNLDPQLQAEIRMIQSSSSFKDSIPSIPIHPQGAGVTKSTLHDRFSQL